MSFTPQQIQAEMDRLDRHDAGASAQGALASVMREFEAEDDFQTVDILSYIKAPWGLAENPYPIQRFILKLIFGMELDDEERDITIWDRFKENQLGQFTEDEFLRFLNAEGRCNLTPEEHTANIGRQKNTIILRMGRRGGKTTISQWVAGYMVYRLLRQPSPQEHYSFRQDQPIRVTLVATGKDQAQDLLSPARASIQRSPFLSRFMRNDSRQKVELTTQRNIERGVGAESGITVQAAPCSARTLRGPANILALLEEYGSFFWELAGSNKSDKSIWEALVPSTADFRNPETGAPEGMVFIPSTPLSKESHMYTVEQQIWEGNITGGLVLHIPSVWVNPNLTTEILKNEWAIDHLSFRQEYEGEYLDQLEAAFTKEQMEACRKNPTPQCFVIQPAEITVMGLDIGLRNDGTGIYVVGVDPENMCRVLHEEYHQAGHTTEHGDWEGYSDLPIDVMAERVDYLWEYWGCKSGYADQWNSYGVKAFLKTAARTRMNFLEITSTWNDRIAKNAIAVINQRRLIIYCDEGQAWSNPDSVFREFVRLQRLQTSGNPPKIKLQAPNVRGFHDDRYSALSRALWAAQEEIEQGRVTNVVKTNPSATRRQKAIRERVDTLRRQRAQRPSSRTQQATALRGQIRRM